MLPSSLLINGSDDAEKFKFCEQGGEESMQELRLKGSSHSSVTPRHEASDRIPNSQFRKALNVVALRAECRMSDRTMSSTTS
jgi:hypothetical protein